MSLQLDTTFCKLVMWVPGRPQTAGSKRGFVNPKTGGVIITESGSAVSKTAKKTYRGDLRDAAVSARRRSWLVDEPVTVPLAIEAVFVRSRPSNHLRRDGSLTPLGMAARPTTRPDATKLLRAAEDALTGVLWLDDSQITQQLAWKAFGDDVGLDPRAEGLLLHVWEARGYFGPRVLSGGARDDAT